MGVLKPGRLAVVLFLLLGSLPSWTQTPSPESSSRPGQYTNPSPGVALQQQSPYSGSVPAGEATPAVLPLSLEDAIARGLKQNLGLLLTSEGIPSARGQWWKDLSELLPNLATSTSIGVRQVNLGSQVGLHVSSFPSVVGPFGVFDTRAYATQSLFDWKAIQQTRASSQRMRAAEYSYRDARELVVFVVTSSYLQTVADSARVDTSVAQRDTALALSRQADDQLKAGTTAAIDALRAKVELQARQQQLISARNNFAKQKIALARVIGLPTGQEFTLTDTALYQPMPDLTLEQALVRAYSSRADYQSALAQERAAELARKAAVAGYFPSLTAAVDYGDIGRNPGASHGTLDAAASLKVPIFQGGKVHGEVLQAQAARDQSRHLLDNLRAQIDQDVRNAFLDLRSAADQVDVARSSLDLANQTLQQARDRFSAGVTDNIEVVQAQQSVAAANESLISSLYAYNVSRIALARATGQAEAGVQDYLKGK